MPRYIDAEKAEKIMHRMDMQDLYMPVHFKEMVLDETPTEEVAPVVHAHWKSCFEDWRNQIEGDECSNCGFQHYGTNIRNYHFCPNCGAKMDEVIGDGA